MACLKISAGEGTPVWSIVELQGAVILPEDWLEESVVELGTLSLSAENADVVELTFGQHQLEGKIVPLKKPLAVLDAVSNSSSSHESDAARPSPERKIIGLIHQKYVFKSRPRPLITKPDI